MFIVSLHCNRFAAIVSHCICNRQTFNSRDVPSQIIINKNTLSLSLFFPISYLPSLIEFMWCENPKLMISIPMEYNCIKNQFYTPINVIKTRMQITVLLILNNESLRHIVWANCVVPNRLKRTGTLYVSDCRVVEQLS